MRMTCPLRVRYVKRFTTQRKVIVTNCNHYFHQDCVMRRYRKGKFGVWFVRRTRSVFNGVEVEAKLKEKEKEWGLITVVVVVLLLVL